MLLGAGSEYSPNDDKIVFKRPNLRLAVPHFQKARFLDQYEAFQNFKKTRIPDVHESELKVAYCNPYLEHIQSGVMGRSAAAALFSHQGLTFDSWTRVGVLFPLLESNTKGGLAMIAVGSSRETALSLFLKNLCIIQSLFSTRRYIATNNFEWAAKRAIYELIKERYGSIKMQRGSISRRTSLAEDGLESAPSITSKSFGARVQDLDDLEPISDIVNLVAQYDNISQFENRLRSPEKEGDFDPISQTRISATTLRLLAEGVPSEEAAAMDPTFKRPVLIPLYTRKKTRYLIADGDDELDQSSRTLPSLAESQEDLEEEEEQGS